MAQLRAQTEAARQESERQQRIAKAYGVAETATRPFDWLNAFARLTSGAGEVAGRAAEDIMHGDVGGQNFFPRALNPADVVPEPPNRPALEKGVERMAQSLPLVAAATAGQAVGIPAPFTFGAGTAGESLAKGASVPEAVRSGVISAAIPAAGGLARSAAANLLNTAVDAGLLSAKRTLVQKGVEALASQGGMQLFAQAVNLPEYATATPDQRKEMIKNAVADTAAWLLMDVPGLVTRTPSETQARMKDLTKAASVLNDLVKHGTAIDEIETAISRTLPRPRGEGTALEFRTGTESRNIPVQESARLTGRVRYVPPSPVRINRIPDMRNTGRTLRVTLPPTIGAPNEPPPENQNQAPSPLPVQQGQPPVQPAEEQAGVGVAQPQDQVNQPTQGTPPTSDVLKPKTETLDLGDGFKAEIDPRAGDIHYLDSSGRTVGRLKTEEGPNGELIVEGHVLSDEARGKGFGGKAIQKLQELTGKTIISDNFMSKDAKSMWQRLGASYEDVTLGQPGFEEQTRRYVLRPKKAAQESVTTPVTEQTVTETTPPVPASEMPKTPTETGLRPAIRLIGGEVVVGNAGKTHPDIIDENKLDAKDIDQRGFVDESGKFLDREQAAAATPEIPTSTEQGRRHSTDLPEAKGGPLITEDTARISDLHNQHAALSGTFAQWAKVRKEGKEWTGTPIEELRKQDREITAELERLIAKQKLEKKSSLGAREVESLKTATSDPARYQQLVAQVRDAISKGQEPDPAITAEIEQIKNRNKGMPPKAEKASVDKYLDTLSGDRMDIGKAKQVLSVAVEKRTQNKTYTGNRAKVIEDMVADGYVPKTEQVDAIKDVTRTRWNRMDQKEQDDYLRRKKEAGQKTEYQLENPEGSFFAVTKTEYEYANWIKSKHPTPEPTHPSPAPKAPEPAASAEKAAEPPPPQHAAPETTGAAPESTTFREKAETLAQKLEGAKLPGPKSLLAGEGLPGGLSAFGVGAALWNDAVSLMQKAIRAGGSLADAIEAAINHIKANFKGKWDEAGARKALASATPWKGSDVLTPEQQSMLGEQPERTRTQVYGVKMGIEREVEKIGPITEQVKANHFDGDAPITPENTVKAAHLAAELTDPKQQFGRAQAVIDDTGAQMSPAILQNQLFTYAIRLAAQKDPTLLNYLINNHGTLQVIGEQGGKTAAGRALRAGTELPYKIVQSLVDYTNQRKKAVGQSLKLSDNFVEELTKTIETMGPDKVDELIKKIESEPIGSGETVGGKIKPKPGEPSTPEEEENVTNSEMERILDRYERSQTEWLKPPGRISAVREEINRAINSGPTAKYTDKLDFIERLSQRFQDLFGAPKDLSDALAKEVWGDKAARESAKTSNLVEREQRREQRNAEAMLDSLQKEQTEWIKPEVRNQTKLTAQDWLSRIIGSGDYQFNEQTWKEGLFGSLRKLNIPEKVSKDLTDELWNRKQAMDASAKVNTAKANETAKRIIDRIEKKLGAEWIKPDADRNNVEEIVKKYLRPTKTLPLEPGEATPKIDPNTRPVPLTDPSFTPSLRDDLIAAGVTRESAIRLAKDAYEQAHINWENARVRGIERAANRGNLRQLIQNMMATPYKMQKDPAWRMKMAQDWLMANGLSRDQAVGVSKLFDKGQMFEKFMQDAAEKAARDFLKSKGTEPRTIEDLVKAIRIGLTDPNREWSEEIAKRTGWRPLTPEMQARLADLDLRASDESLNPYERVKLYEQISDVWRKTGDTRFVTWRNATSSYASSLLSGLSTTFLHWWQPYVATLHSFMSNVIAHPENVVNLVNALGRATFMVPGRQYQFAWTEDAYRFNLEKNLVNYDSLKRQMQIGLEELKKPTTAAKGLLRVVYGSQHYVQRVLQTLNQGGMASHQYWKLAAYGSDLLKRHGFSVKEIGQWLDIAKDVKESEYAALVNDGVSEKQAGVMSDHLVQQALADGLADRVGDAEAAQAVRATEGDVYAVVGRLSPGVKEREEGGWVSRYGGGHFLLDVAAKARATQGPEAIQSISILGFVAVPARMARYHLNNTLYGLVRYNKAMRQFRAEAEAQRTGAVPPEQWWKQSYANGLQARERLRNALFGSGLMLGAGAVAGAFGFNTANPDWDKKTGIYFTGHGPTSKTEQDALSRLGWRKFSMLVVAGGKVRAAIPLTRTGLSFGLALGVGSVFDDIAWDNKAATAAGRKPPAIGRELAHALGTYAEIVGSQGALQSIAELSKAVRGEENLDKLVVRALTQVLGPTLTPWKQLQDSIFKLFVGNPDRSSVESAVWSAFGLAGYLGRLAAPERLGGVSNLGQEVALNRFGDPLYDQSWYARLAGTGLPIAIRLADTPQNKELYSMMVNKGTAPPDLRRSNIEEQYGPLSDLEWNKFVKASGSQLKERLLDNLDTLKEMDAPAVKQFMNRQAQAANVQAAQSLDLERQPGKGRAVGGGGGGPAPSTSLPRVAAASSGGGGGALRPPRLTSLRAPSVPGAGRSRRVSLGGRAGGGRRVSFASRPSRLVHGRLRTRTSHKGGKGRRPSLRRRRVTF